MSWQRGRRDRDERHLQEHGRGQHLGAAGLQGKRATARQRPSCSPSIRRIRKRFTRARRRSAQEHGRGEHLARCRSARQRRPSARHRSAGFGDPLRGHGRRDLQEHGRRSHLERPPRGAGSAWLERGARARSEQPRDALRRLARAGVLKSTDSGRSWDVSTAGMAGAGVDEVAAPSRGSAYALVGSQGLFKRAHHGWRLLFAGPRLRLSGPSPSTRRTPRRSMW